METLLVFALALLFIIGIALRIVTLVMLCALFYMVFDLWLRKRREAAENIAFTPIK